MAGTARLPAGPAPASREARDLDAALARVARSRGALDLAIGETLVRLFKGDRLLRLGYSRQADYARERLGVPPRTMFLFTRLARGLATRPFLRRAVLLGAVSPRKALAVLRAATGEDERSWTAAAMCFPLRRLEEALRADGKEAPASFETESLWFRMKPEEQDRLDAALGLAQLTIGPGAPRWMCLEAVCQEWLGSFGTYLAYAAVCRPAGEEAARPDLAALERHLAVLEEAAAPVAALPPGGDDARALDARARRLLRARREHDELFGSLAARVARERVWDALGFFSFAEYCRERLGCSARTVRQRVWLERRMCALPALREALRAGRLPYTKALLVAKDATPHDVEERIAEAASTTCQQLGRDATAREERQNRAAGFRRVWGPADAAQTVADAITAARIRSTRLWGRPIGAGEALAQIADHFLHVWIVHLQDGRRRGSRAREAVLRRHGGLCGVPGCSRPAEHVHHIRYRSHGGTDDPSNVLALCRSHHLGCVHRGSLTVTGRAGERLAWRFGEGRGTPVEAWVTLGDDDVRRARVHGPTPPPRPPGRGPEPA